MPSNSPPINNRKFNLRGRRGMGCECSRGVSVAPQKRMGQLGDASADIPAGTQLTYTATISSSFNPLKSAFYSMGSVISAVTQNLQSQWGIAVVSSSIPFSIQGNQVTLKLQTGTDYGAVQDIKSIVDGSFYNAAGATIQSSSLIVNVLAQPKSVTPTSNVAAPNPPSPNTLSDPTAAALYNAYQNDVATGNSSQAAVDYSAYQQYVAKQQPFDLSSWFSDNWLWIAAAGVGVVAARDLL